MPNEPGPADNDSQEELLFIIDIDYISNLQRIDRLLPDHRRWLEEHFNTGTFLISGPKQPRSGGTVLARGRTLKEIESLAATDPFILARAAVNRVIAFRPTTSTISLEPVKPEH